MGNLWPPRAAASKAVPSSEQRLRGVFWGPLLETYPLWSQLHKTGEVAALPGTLWVQPGHAEAHL